MTTRLNWVRRSALSAVVVLAALTTTTGEARTFRWANDGDPTTIFLGMDQAREELLESNVKGKNPFKDKRVRQAFYQAIDEDAIKTKVMRAFARPTAQMVRPGINGSDAALDKRFPYDPLAARKLLGEAGYPDGFEVGFDCPTDRYVNDEAICQAVVAMLARIGVKANLLAQTKAKYFTKINAPGFQTSFYMLGWTPGPLDALNMLSNLAATRSEGLVDGLYNNGGYSNPQLDQLIKKIQVELDGEKRNELISEALSIVKEDSYTSRCISRSWYGRAAIMSISCQWGTTTSSCAM